MECHEERGVAVARNDLRRNRLRREASLFATLLRTERQPGPDWTRPYKRRPVYPGGSAHDARACDGTDLVLGN